ncbi:MAG: glycosyltransferase family 2 protein [Lachnospiraceae bacterium]|nr:glycosyltransferase family 2 protein [Lachnospiraceae bacterium]
MSKVRTAASFLKRFGLRRTLFYYDQRRLEKELPFSCFSLNGLERDHLWKLAKRHPISFGKVGEAAEYWLLIPQDATIAPDFMAACSIRIAECKKRPVVVYTDLAVTGALPVEDEGTLWEVNLPGVGACHGCFFPDYALETAEVLDFFGGAICVAADWAKERGLDTEEAIRSALRQHAFGVEDVLHVDRILSHQEHMVASLQETLAVRNSEKPLVSIVIPNKDQVETLKACLDSILTKTTYPNYEVVVIENNSIEEATFAYYESLKEPVRVVTCITDWNYSYINNYGVRDCKGEILLFLNNDTEIRSGDWLDEMVSYAQHEGVGAVGAKLLYPDETIQHGGVTVGIRGVAGHGYIGWPGDAKGYLHRLEMPQNVGAVTAACMMVPRKVFEQVGGFDEDMKVAFNDTDLCMKIRDAGYRIVLTPQVVLTHFESKSRGRDEQNPEKLARFNRESMTFQRRWFNQLRQGDPSYNVHLSYDNDNFEVKHLWT